MLACSNGSTLAVGGYAHHTPCGGNPNVVVGVFIHVQLFLTGQLAIGGCVVVDGKLSIIINNVAHAVLGIKEPHGGLVAVEILSFAVVAVCVVTELTQSEVVAIQGVLWRVGPQQFVFGVAEQQ